MLKDITIFSRELTLFEQLVLELVCVGALLFFVLGIAAVLHRRNTSDEVLI